MLKKTMIRIDPDMWPRLKSLAALERKTLTAKLNELISREIMKHDMRQLEVED